MESISIDNHLLRKKLGLSINEFAVLLELSTSNQTVINVSLALGINKSTVHKIISILIDRDLIEKKSEFYRFTERFYYLNTSFTPNQKNMNESSLVYVYLMIDEHTGLHKIGKSKNVHFREKTLLSQIPKIKLIHSFCRPDVSEKNLHEKYAHKRRRGEWFDLNRIDVEYIKSL